MAFFPCRWISLIAVALLNGTAHAESYSPPFATNDLNNPHKGFMLWGTDYSFGPPSNYYGATIYHVYMPWREVEPADQVFDWGTFETNHLLPILADHPEATFVIRPVADYPDGPASGIAHFYGGAEPHRDFPSFLTNAPLNIPAYPYEQCDGDGPGITPDWNHPAMITQLVQFIRAFAGQYDGDPRITAVQVGLLGLWGEWHQSGCPDRAPSNAVKIAVRDAYKTFFTNTPIQIRCPRDPDSIGTGFGFHEDYFPSYTAPCVYGFPECSDDGDWNLAYCFSNVNPAAATNWRINPISGESPLLSQKQAWSTHSEAVMTVIRDYHFSFLGPAGGHKFPGNEEKLLPMKRQLGYNYHIERVTWPSPQECNRPFRMSITMTNSGSAPCYHPFRLEVAICASSRLGEPFFRYALTNDLRELIPGEARTWTAQVPAPNLPPGVYSLRIGVLDPRTGEPGVRIQSAGEDPSRRIVIGEIELIGDCVADVDRDGLPDEWESRYFGNPTNAAPDADSDGDGQSNWEHFLSGTEPINAADFFRIHDFSAVTASVIRLSVITNRLYRLWRAASLTGMWTTVTGVMPSAEGSWSLSEADWYSSQFYRVSVELPAR